MAFIIGKDRLPDAEPAGGSGGGGGSYVIDVGVENFEQEVIARSLSTPVLLDLWATWCGPCKTLGPLLEKVANSCGGAFILAKCDVDANQEIAAALRVRSVPTVVLFKDGRPVDAFMGALPEAQVKAFLEKHVSLKAPAAKPAEGTDPAALLGEGRIDEAQRIIGPTTDPLVQLRALLLAGNAPGARKALGTVGQKERDAAVDLIEAAQRLLQLLENPSPEFAVVAAALLQRDLPRAFDLLLSGLDPEKKRVVLDLLVMMGRGSAADEVRSRLSRIIFR